MADRERPRSASSVPYHPLVEALAPDPNQPPKRATRLFGYPGPAADSKSTRLWLDLDLSRFVDVPDTAILHSRTLDGDRGTILWVDSEARLEYSDARSHEVQAKFLGGAITESNLGCSVQTVVPVALSERGEVTWTDNPPCLLPQSLTLRECHTRECRSVEWICPLVETTDLPCPSWDSPCERA
ncbi:MAG TPA: hypothetical protein VNC16_01775 [Solirubrobacterales bacterium]|jgi:hypothetical protein|nr:hypothetical protein [Solirubrobacterales bacterium]